MVFPLDEAILEALTGLDRPWDDLHHRSYFLLELIRIEEGGFVLTMTGDRSFPMNHLATHTVYAKGNMETITKMIPIDISKTPSVMENVFIWVDCSLEDIQIYIDLFKEFRDVFAWSYKEMTSIDPRIVEHEIMTYPNSKPVQQNLRPINPCKEATIKAEVENYSKMVSSTPSNWLNGCWI